jgi:SAM-dependent methyltransferase
VPRCQFPTGCIDLACFAQAWHWLDPTTRVAEMHRILRPGGRWAGWWSHARADDEPWFDQYWSTIERRCPSTNRSQRDTDWGATVADGGLFEVEARRDLAWTRTITIEDWVTDQASQQLRHRPRRCHPNTTPPRPALHRRRRVPFGHDVGAIRDLALLATWV